MSRHFTHLHLHTEYSLLDGAISLDRLVSVGKERGHKALAITDHGNIFGAVKFFQKCKKAGIKPVLGMEAYITEDVKVRSAQNKYYHIILLVENSQGYKNLCKLIAHSYREGFYFKPRIDYALLEKYHEGLIATSACLGGHIPKMLESDDMQGAIAQIEWFESVFGKDRFYLEVQPEDQKEQAVLNQKLYKLASERKLPLLATGDCHYVCADDREAHEVMLALQTHDKLDNPDRYTFGDCRVYMRTQEQMLEIFSEYEQAVWNSGVIADRCNFDFETGKLFFPKFPIPKDDTPESYFVKLCEKGLYNRKSVIKESAFSAYQARLQLEMDLIISMGFVEYFLVVGDFIQWAYRNGVPVGPGRGSAAGSLVSWCLQITNIDPLKYNLLFERFLNPERVTMPDIDIDFCIEGRDRVINYICDKYGHDKTCHIITFGTMMAKGVLKDVARVLGFPFEDSNAMTSLVPDQLKITLDEALEQEPRLQELVDNNPKAKRLFDIAHKLEGLTRHASKHAAGIVISPDPIDEVLPVYVPPKSDELVAQYAMTELESIGFLKIDLLGLKNLTLIARAVEAVKKNYGIHVDVDSLPLDDEKTFELICSGKTSGVFQLESSGLKEVLRKLKPDKFEDIIAVNALYRPGPLGSGMVDDYIERRHGRQKIVYLFDELEPILQETYGVIVYQEQVMKIASTIGGYSLGEADILRRAMGKKKVEVMAEQREIFLKRSKERKFDEKKAGELFDLMAYFAGYGFNKSHSAAYALIAYQTAYLKANYTSEFMAALISLEATHVEKMAFYLQEAKDMGISLIAPNINRSEVAFTAAQDGILFGLHGIKNVGHTALENIITNRREKGEFKDILDFCKRLDLRTVNKRVIENLICSGTLDSLPGNRAQKFEALGPVMDAAIAFKRDAATGQMGVFGAKNKQEENKPYDFVARSEWSNTEILEKEKEVLGFYLSSHPLETYQTQCRWFGVISFKQAHDRAMKNTEEIRVVCCGLLKGSRIITTKKGDRMAFAQLEGVNDSAEVIIFPRVFARVEQWLADYKVFVVKGAVDVMGSNGCKIKADDFVPIELVLQEWKKIQHAMLRLPNDVDDQLLSRINDKCVAGNIPVKIMLTENGKQLQIATKKRIALDGELAQFFSDLGVVLTVGL